MLSSITNVAGFIDGRQSLSLNGDGIDRRRPANCKIFLFIYFVGELIIGISNV